MNPAPQKYHYVYILNSTKKDFLYIGATSDLKNRLNEHREGKCYSTKKYLPVKLVYYEAFLSKSDAFDREKKLKYHGKSLKLLKNRICNSLRGAG
ncbi:MAG: GIY-YIG nuclease family protein [bacterium]